MIHMLRIIFFVVASCAALIILGHIFISAVKAKKSGNYTKIIYNALTAVCIIIAALSWVLNLGWVRYIFSLAMLPVLHCILFWFIENYAASYSQNSKILGISIFISYVTFIMFYIFLPDFNEQRTIFALFNTITSTTAIDMCFYISMASLILNTATLIFQIIFCMIIKHKKINSKYE